jgi:uncharacterized membrane protein YjfL (UPF0719 family)
LAAFGKQESVIVAIESISHVEGGQAMPDIIYAYVVTFGWAITGSIGMGLGIIIALKLFDLSTTKVDEWELIKQGNMAMATVLAAVIVSLGIVIAAAIR